jgi:hypothetical protein
MLEQFFSAQNDLTIDQVPLPLILLGIWSLIWKAIALWVSARKSQKVWFVSIFILTTAGFLELVYLGFFQKGRPNIIAKWKEKNSSKMSSSKGKKRTV